MPATLAEIKAAVSSGEPFYVGTGRFYIVPYNGTPKGGVDYAKEGVAGEGIMPLYQRCVHLGCRVPFCGQSKWFECPCHGSKYNSAGEYQLGPAPRGMDRFHMEIVGGRVHGRHLRGGPRAAARDRHDRPAAARRLLRGAGIGGGRERCSHCRPPPGSSSLIAGGLIAVAAVAGPRAPAADPRDRSRHPRGPPAGPLRCRARDAAAPEAPGLERRDAGVLRRSGSRRRGSSSRRRT